MKRVHLLILLISVSCTFQHNKVTTAEDSFGKACEPISFAQVQAEIFGTSQSPSGKCLACHTPGGPLLALDSHAAVIARLTQIEDSVRNNRMPKNAVLPGASKQLLFAWIQQGAPELAKDAKVIANCDAPTDTPVPTEVQIEPHYDSLRKEIFASKCIGCHNDSGIFSSYDFSTYKSISAYKKLFVMPEDGGDSRFVHSLVTGKMPRGAPPLPTEHIEIIRQWVTLGLPENASAVGVGVGAPNENNNTDNHGNDDNDDNQEVQLPPATEPTEPAATCDLIDFQTVNTQIFQTACTRCHDFTSKVNLESYENIKQHLSAVKWMIQTDKMPPRKPLDPALKGLVLKWIDQGAPETVTLPEICETKGGPK